jgi:streptogramin lyase
MHSAASPSKPSICTTATWSQYGITIIGGKDHRCPFMNLNDPQGMFIDENQTVYVADSGNHRVLKWEQDASSVEIIADENGRENMNTNPDIPLDVIVDKNGTIYIVYLRSSKVQKLVRGGGRVDAMLNIDSPISIAIDNEESIYVSSMSSSKVKKWRKGATNGQVLVSGDFGPYYLAVDQHRSVYMADSYNSRVLKIDEGRTNISVVVGRLENNGTHRLSSPHAVAVDESGVLYVTEWVSHRVTRWLPGSTNGIVIVGDHGSGSRPDQLDHPTDLGFDSTGNLYVVDGHNGRVQKFLIDNSSCQ